jgi:hypothetical protein
MYLDVLTTSYYLIGLREVGAYQLDHERLSRYQPRTRGPTWAHPGWHARLCLRHPFGG